MVRLRPYSDYKYIPSSVQFQFLYGTIKTQENARKPTTFNSISIPVWYD